MFVFNNQNEIFGKEKIDKIKKEIKQIEETEEELKKNKKEEKIKYYKMLIIFNAIEDGWTVKKSNGTYKFYKKNQDRDEMLQESHIDTFLRESFDYLSNIFKS